MEQNQITINEEKREQEARKYCDYTFERYGVDADTYEAQLIRNAHVHGYNAGFEAARKEMEEMDGKNFDCGFSLKSAASKYRFNYYTRLEKMGIKCHPTNEQMENVERHFIQGAKMILDMQGALDGEVIVGDEVQLCVPELPRITRTMDDGDKVKVLIFKKV